MNFYKKKEWKYFFIFFTAIAVICSLQVSIAYLIFQPKNFNFLFILSYMFPAWWAWFLLMPLILKLNVKFPINKDNWIRSVTVHLILGFLMMFIHLFLYSLWSFYINESSFTEREFLSHYSKLLLTSSWPQTDILLYWGVLAVVYVLNYFEVIRKKEIRNLQLETSLNQARLNALRMQIHPHFMFNTLNAISTLILRGNTDESVDTISKFSSLLRKSIETKDKTRVSVKEEIDFIKSYLEIEQVRFKDKLSVSYNVDQAILEFEIPPLILQPLIENCLKHGISIEREVIEIHISVRYNDEKLILEVSDNGSGMALPYNPDKSKGIGLSNTINRLKTIYGDHVNIFFQNKQMGGLTVLIEIDGV